MKEMYQIECPHTRNIIDNYREKILRNCHWTDTFRINNVFIGLFSGSCTLDCKFRNTSFKIVLMRYNNEYVYTIYQGVREDFLGRLSFDPLTKQSEHWQCALDACLDLKKSSHKTLYDNFYDIRNFLQYVYVSQFGL